jgi:membrane fusion protein, multidrug efflux system
MDSSFKAIPCIHRNSILASMSTLAIILLAQGCTRKTEAAAPPPPPHVSVANPAALDITEWDEYTGRLGAVESVDVRARISGYLDSIHFTDGQLVKKDDLLFVIDPRPFKAVLDAAQADAAQAASRLELAGNDHERAKKLIATGAISQEDFDTRAKAAQTAQATLLAARARIEQARLNVEFTEVRAPMAGRIGRHQASVGNLITGGAADSTTLTSIVAVNPIYCYFDISEQDYLKYLRLQQAKEAGVLSQGIEDAQVGLMDEEGFPHPAKIDFFDNQVDQGSGTLRGRAVIDNAALGLVPGVFVKIRMPGSAKHAAVLVPDRAVQTDQSDRFVLVVGEGNIIKSQRVTLGRRHDGLRIVTGGLTKADSIVVEGIQRARVGSPVTPDQTVIKLASEQAPPATAKPEPAVAAASVPWTGDTR